MKFRSIIVNGKNYGWRIWGSADNIEVRGPNGLRVFADAEDVTGVGWWKLHTEFHEFDRRNHNNPFYVKYPITPKLIAAWIAKHESDLAGEVRHPAKPRHVRRSRNYRHTQSPASP